MFGLVPLLLLVVAIAGSLLQDQSWLNSAIDCIVALLPDNQSQKAVDSRLTAREQSTTTGIISFIGLFWIGTSFVTTLARAMDRIYRVPERNFVKNRIRALALVLAFCLLLVASVIFAAVLTYFVNGGIPD